MKSAASKARLCAALDPGNVEQTMAAPVTAFVAHDMRFFELMPKLTPSRPEMAARFGSSPEAVRERLAFQSGTLQGAYLMLAARAVGLDCGPMGGFDRGKVDAEFFPDGTLASERFCRRRKLLRKLAPQAGFAPGTDERGLRIRLFQSLFTTLFR